MACVIGITLVSTKPTLYNPSMTANSENEKKFLSFDRGFFIMWGIFLAIVIFVAMAYMKSFDFTAKSVKTTPTITPAKN